MEAWSAAAAAAASAAGIESEKLLKQAELEDKIYLVTLQAYEAANETYGLITTAAALLAGAASNPAGVQESSRRCWLARRFEPCGRAAWPPPPG